MTQSRPELIELNKKMKQTVAEVKKNFTELSEWKEKLDSERKNFDSKIEEEKLEEEKNEIESDEKNEIGKILAKAQKPLEVYNIGIAKISGELIALHAYEKGTIDEQKTKAEKQIKNAEKEWEEEKTTDEFYDTTRVNAYAQIKFSDDLKDVGIPLTSDEIQEMRDHLIQEKEDLERKKENQARNEAPLFALNNLITMVNDLILRLNVLMKALNPQKSNPSHDEITETIKTIESTVTTIRNDLASLGIIDQEHFSSSIKKSLDQYFQILKNINKIAGKDYLETKEDNTGLIDPIVTSLNNLKLLSQLKEEKKKEIITPPTSSGGPRLFTPDKKEEKKPKEVNIDHLIAWIKHRIAQLSFWYPDKSGSLSLKKNELKELKQYSDRPGSGFIVYLEAFWTKELNKHGGKIQSEQPDVIVQYLNKHAGHHTLRFIAQTLHDACALINPSNIVLKKNDPELKALKNLMANMKDKNIASPEYEYKPEPSEDKIEETYKDAFNLLKDETETRLPPSSDPNHQHMRLMLKNINMFIQNGIYNYERAYSELKEEVENMAKHIKYNRKNYNPNNPLHILIKKVQEYEFLKPQGKKFSV